MCYTKTAIKNEKPLFNSIYKFPNKARNIIKSINDFFSSSMYMHFVVLQKLTKLLGVGIRGSKIVKYLMKASMNGT